MFKFFKRLSIYGTSPGFKTWENRNIIIANSIALCVAILLSTFIMLDFFIYRSSALVVTIFMSMVLSNIFTLFLSKYGYIKASKFLLTVANCSGMLVMTIADKKSGTAIHDAYFFLPRTALLLLCIIPLAIYQLEERVALISSMIFGFLTLILFDPIHYLFGVDYYQMGFQDDKYYFANVVYFLFYSFLIGSFGFFKKNIESFERKNHLLVHSLRGKTEIVQAQKVDLESKNYILEKLLSERDKDLSKVTEELFRYNQELLEYSYTLSHKIRGPVASVLGLLNLIRITRNQTEIREYLKKLEQSVLALDNIIYDLNNIADIQQESYQTRDLVYFREEFEKVINHLKPKIRDYDVKISEDFKDAPEIYSVQEKIYYVLNELITNAIQFRKPDRQLEIFVRTYRQGDNIVIEVRDNGSGMDLDSYGDDLFKPFKRFHPDASGTGLGLYILKLIVEKLQGEIIADSSRKFGTIVKVILKNRLN
ncbi:sensor protein divL [Sporocytophaga myxococcoides]|uniref:histidine kinase n=1 Tax=Sporocytophaga myxococcoides TaxID=153721 RepID=A0A098LC24_9BACT|nr:HAMP domain-containing sensor histidine kinase [Sporocytophaga myxococcoides]GAL84505.1 sensor protein divL [Sporocytophaga myxococcoides]